MGVRSLLVSRDQVRREHGSITPGWHLGLVVSKGPIQAFCSVVTEWTPHLSKTAINPAGEVIAIWTNDRWQIVDPSLVGGRVRPAKFDERASSFLYVFRTVGAGFLKVGWAKIVERRLAQVQTCCPHDLVIAAVAPGDIHAETTLHRLLTPWRQRGEWYSDTPPVWRAAGRFNLEDGHCDL